MPVTPTYSSYLRTETKKKIHTFDCRTSPPYPSIHLDLIVFCFTFSGVLLPYSIQSLNYLTIDTLPTVLQPVITLLDFFYICPSLSLSSECLRYFPFVLDLSLTDCTKQFCLRGLDCTGLRWAGTERGKLRCITTYLRSIETFP